MIPFVTITLDRPYECRLGYSESILYQQLTGKKLSDVAEVTLDNLAGLLCAMIKKHVPDLTVEKTEQMLDEYADSIVAIVCLVAACIDNAYNLDDKSPNVKTLATLNRLPTI